MKHNTSLYMFALVPPDNIASDIDLLRRDFSQRFDFQKALKPPVHITLFEPFLIPAEISAVFEQYISQLQHWANHQSPFKIDLRDFKFFNNPQHPVVYVNVIRTSRIINFHSGFLHELSRYYITTNRSDSYKPHLTIGYRDVTPEAFPRIREYYSKQTFTSSFVCRTFYLWKHNGTNWQVIKTYFLDGKGEQLELF